jgi:hypothetical protein
VRNQHILRVTYAFYNLTHHAEIVPILPTSESEIDRYATAQIPHIIEMGNKETGGAASIPEEASLVPRACVRRRSNSPSGPLRSVRPR